MGFLKWLFKAVFVLLLVALLLLGGSWVTVWLLSTGKTMTETDMPKTDVAIVFGAAVWSGQPSPYLQGRLDVAADLYRSGKVEVIIVSGSVDEGYNEPQAMRKALIAAGVKETKIVVDEGGVDTYTSCKRAHDVFGVRQAVLITQSYHIPRAVASCSINGIDAIGVGDDSPAKNMTWNWYTAREFAGDAKLVFDWIRGRTIPKTGTSDAVQVALQLG